MYDTAHDMLVILRIHHMHGCQISAARDDFLHLDNMIVLHLFNMQTNRVQGLLPTQWYRLCTRQQCALLRLSLYFDI